MHRESPRTIVLMTDFGVHDTYVGQMKGVILSRAPSVQIIDLTHSISPQNIVQGAFFLGKSVPFLPERSIILSVVDPGVGSTRQAIAVETDKQTFLAPDNGLLTAVFQTRNITRCVSITEQQYMLPCRSSTFHGRDVFSPAAAHLANGGSLQELGNAIDLRDCITITMPQCNSCDQGESWDGSVIYTDHFGNLVTSLDSTLFDTEKHWMVGLDNGNRIPVVTTYSAVPDQQLLAYTGSSGMIEIAVRNGSAAEKLGLKEGYPVKLSIRS